MNEKVELIDMTAEIVSAYVGNNAVAVAELPALIHNVYEALTQIDGPAPNGPARAQKPAVPVKDSISADYLICLEDGQKFKSLKRHLRTHYNLSPEEYREKWGLAKDYPMVAPNYAQTRSALAKKMGLGQSRSAPAPRRRRKN